MVLLKCPVAVAIVHTFYLALLCMHIRTYTALSSIFTKGTGPFDIPCVQTPCFMYTYVSLYACLSAICPLSQSIQCKPQASRVYPLSLNSCVCVLGGGGGAPLYSFNFNISMYLNVHVCVCSTCVIKDRMCVIYYSLGMCYHAVNSCMAYFTMLSLDS